MTDARADLEALAKRCESEEPSWELCIAIELATTPGAKKFLGKGPFEIEKDDRRYNPPAYCFSLDAAVSLYIKKPPTISSDPRLVAADALRARAAMEAA